MDVSSPGAFARKALEDCGECDRTSLENGGVLQVDGVLFFAEGVEGVSKSLKPFWCELRSGKAVRHYLEDYSLLNHAGGESRKHKQLYVAFDIPEGQGAGEYIVTLRSFQGAGGMTTAQPGPNKLFVHGLKYLYPQLPSLETMRRALFLKNYAGPYSEFVKATLYCNYGAVKLYSKMRSMRQNLGVWEPEFKKGLLTYFRHSPYCQRLEEKVSQLLPPVSSQERRIPTLAVATSLVACGAYSVSVWLFAHSALVWCVRARKESKRKKKNLKQNPTDLPRSVVWRLQVLRRTEPRFRK